MVEDAAEPAGEMERPRPPFKPFSLRFGEVVEWKGSMEEDGSPERGEGGYGRVPGGTECAERPVPGGGVVGREGEGEFEGGRGRGGGVDVFELKKNFFDDVYWEGREIDHGERG